MEGKGDEQSQDKSQGSKSAKRFVHARVKPRTLLHLVLNTRNQRTSSETQESAFTYHVANSYTDNFSFDCGWSCVVWNDDWSSVGWHEGWEQTYENSASSLSLGSSDLGAVNSPTRLGRVNMNLDTGAAVNTIPLNVGTDGAGNGRFLHTASG